MTQLEPDSADDARLRQPGIPQEPAAADLTGRQQVTADELPGAVKVLLDNGFRPALVAAHQQPDSFRVEYAFLAAGSRRAQLSLTVPAADPRVPSLAGLSFPLGRFEREMRDLYGIVPDGHPLPHRLVRHQHWPRGWYPMRSDLPVPVALPENGEPFPFTRVEGQGVYEIPVGPIHAGLIEPGHFRFSVVGETILRAKARLWFLHKGIEKLFEGRTPVDGLALAERISGDTSVGHAWAYLAAVEEALGIDPGEPALLLRAVLLELERLYNHVTDLGALANDVGHGVLAVQAAGVREQLLRLNEEVTGSRLLRGALFLGGTGVRALPGPDRLSGIGAEIAELAELALEHTVVRDRFTGTGVLAPQAARDLGVLGYVARACGLEGDARLDHPAVDLAGALRPVRHDGGDVLARFCVRRDECAASIDLLTDLLTRLGGTTSGGNPSAATGSAATASGETDSGATDSGVPRAGLGVIEGWRGTIVHRVELAADGTLGRVKVVDPSFFTWPALPLALGDTIVPDFPLTNKSFNLSYAGNDL
ncbi:MAG TPA: NADH-quinone oxidoreductase subunit C [Kineosporiaceae bacterium]|nr:NADH-quinone oxidoreductase subunit C [Kineosporiaceae bacterium]